MVPWCSRLTRLPVTQKIAGSSPVGTAIYGFIAQSVEHLTFNQRVMSSNLIQVTMCLSGGIGRRTGLKILRALKLVPVQVRPQAPFIFYSAIRRSTQEAEGTGLENRKVVQAAQGFKSLLLRQF